jgi:hypothetical protein
MRSKVADWQPPRTDHQGLKDFMIEQLDQTISFDGKPGDFYLEKAVRVSGAQWRSDKLQEITRSIEYHTKEQKSEVERVATRNKWVADLRKSL